MTHEKHQQHNTNSTGSPGTLSARDQQTEEALRVSEDPYRTLVEFQPDLLCRFLPDTTLTFVNDPYCEYFGMAREELLGRSFLVFIPENERAASAARIRSLNLAKPVGFSEHHVVNANGEVRWHQWTNKAIFDYRGEIIEFQATGRDITEKKRVEEELHKSEGMFRAIWETAVDAMLITDQQGTVLRVNPAFHRIYGYTPAQIIGQPAWIIVPKELHEELRLGQEGLFLSPQESFHLEAVVVCADGTQRFVTSNASFLTVDGQRTALLSVLHDITDRKQGEEAMQRVNENLTQRLKDLSTLNQISQVISTVAYTPSALEVVGKTMANMFNASRLTISFLDEDKPRLMVLTHIERTPKGDAEAVDTMNGQIILLEQDPIAQHVVRDEQTVILSATTGPPSLVTARRKLRDEGIYCSMMTPLQSRGRTVGLITISADQPDRLFSPAEIGLVQTISGSIATAIETSRLLVQEQQHRLTAESLRDVVASLASSLDQETIIRRIFEQLRRIVPHTGASLYLKKRASLVVMEATGDDAHQVGARLPIAREGLPQQVYKSKQPQLLTDLASHPEWHSNNLTKNARCWMGAPLATDKRTIGVLTVDDHGPVTYSDENLHALQEFSHHAAIAIDNAQRYQEAHIIAADEERNRLARDLHDSVTQALFSANLITDVLPHLYQEDTEEGQQALKTLRYLTHGALAEMRSLLLELRPADLLHTRLDNLIAQLSSAATMRMPLEVTSSLDRCPRLPEKVHIAFYRITQEALNNIVKHAKGGKIRITLQTTPPVSTANADEWSGTITLTIADDGVGFVANRIANGNMGLASMRERARSIKATLDIDSAPGSGTAVKLTWRGATVMKVRNKNHERYTD